MTLAALRLANFNAFGAAQRIPLRSITLVFGATSAGKSRPIRALALARHAVETGEIDTQRAQIGGEALDRGFRKECQRRLPGSVPRSLRLEMVPAYVSDTAAIAGTTATSLTDLGGVIFGIGLDEGSAPRV